jgi:hypothetical protein
MRVTPAAHGGNKSTLNLATRVASLAGQAAAPANLQALSKRMVGLEPTTFCMASDASFPPGAGAPWGPPFLHG